MWSCCVPRGREAGDDGLDDYEDHDTYGVVNDPRKNFVLALKCQSFFLSFFYLSVTFVVVVFYNFAR